MQFNRSCGIFVLLNQILSIPGLPGLVYLCGGLCCRHVYGLSCSDDTLRISGYFMANAVELFNAKVVQQCGMSAAQTHGGAKA